MATLRDRFEEKYIPEPNSGCWLWIGSCTSHGYGQLSTKFKQSPIAAHRVAYELFIGPIPPGLEIDHKCRVRSCVNPEHLEPVTRAENLRRGLNGVLKTHCPHGHELTAENTRTRKTSRGKLGRICRICDKEHCRQYYYTVTRVR